MNFFLLYFLLKSFKKERNSFIEWRAEIWADGLKSKLTYERKLEPVLSLERGKFLIRVKCTEWVFNQFN